MNSWETIKEAFTSGTTPGSTGYFWALVRASDLYCELRFKLKDEKSSDKTFNEDKSVTEALLNRGKLEVIANL